MPGNTGEPTSGFEPLTPSLRERARQPANTAKTPANRLLYSGRPGPKPSGGRCRFAAVWSPIGHPAMGQVGAAERTKTPDRRPSQTWWTLDGRNSQVCPFTAWRRRATTRARGSWRWKRASTPTAPAPSTTPASPATTSSGGTAFRTGGVKRVIAATPRRERPQSARARGGELKRLVVAVAVVQHSAVRTCDLSRVKRALATPSRPARPVFVGP
jgi:hypothetical protein